MASSACDPPSRTFFNRLSIAHLMLWTLGSALVLAFQRVSMVAAFETEIGVRLQTAVSLFAIMHSLPAGAQLAGLILWVHHRFSRTDVFPMQPSHWLLVIPGLVFVANLCAWAGTQVFDWPLERFAVRASWDVDLVRFASLFELSAAVSAVAYFVALRKMAAEGRLWRGAMACFIAQSAFVLLLCTFAFAWAALSGDRDSDIGHWAIALSCINFGFGLIGGLLLVVAAISDPHRKNRDFLHWAGIVALLVPIVLTPVETIYLVVKTWS